MYGAILGDIVGSPYEFDCNNYKAKDFPLFSRRSDFTDDTVMTLAVAKALLSTRGQDDAAIKAALVREMQQLGRAYPDRGYGTHFGSWLYEDDPQPYQSYGNGSAMRASSAAWLAKDMAESLHLARLTAEVLVPLSSRQKLFLRCSLRLSHTWLFLHRLRFFARRLRSEVPCKYRCKSSYQGSQHSLKHG